MRLKEKIEKRGYWWLPANPENRLTGTLRITESGDAELDVLGNFNDDFLKEDGNIDRIIGVIEGGKYVTLENCYSINWSTSSGGISITTRDIQYVFIGVHYDENEIINFSSYKISVEGLEEWFLFKNFDVNDKNEKSISIKYSSPDNIIIELSNDLKLIISIEYSGYYSINEVKLNQKVYLKIESINSISFLDFERLLFKIKNFFCFALDETLSITSATGYSNEILANVGEKKYPEPIEIYYSNTNYSDIPPKLNISHFFLKYREISNDIKNIIKLWYDSYEIFKPVFNHYFACKSGAYKFIESRFIALTQALEAYHRRISNDVLMPQEEFEKIVSNIIENCPDTKKKWLSGKLKYANELTLSKRLGQLFKPYKTYFGNKKEVESLIYKISSIRNQLTHYDPAKKNKIISGKEYFNLCWKMEKLLKLHFLHILSFSEEQIKKIVENNQRFMTKEF